MVKLAELVAEVGGRCSFLEDGGPSIADVFLDSRDVTPGSLFAALPGTRGDGGAFVEQACERGAAALLVPEATATAPGLPRWEHPQARAAAGLAAAIVQGHPTRSLFVVGVTGTNGKTTTTHLIAQLLGVAGRRCGVIGTTGHRLADGQLLPTRHTTPDAPALQRLARTHKELGGDALAIEISSHALDQDRAAGLALDVGVFTNLSRDHLDYHGSMEQYAAAKARMFTSLEPGAVAIVNADDPHHRTMSDAAQRSGAEVVTYGIGSSVDLGASGLRTGLQGSVLYLTGMGIPGTRIELPLLGRHNVSNALAASAVVLWSGASPSTLVEGLATVFAPPGRLEPVPTGARGFRVFVDYAHTDAALAMVLDVVREALEGEGGGRLICVFGAGGDRDRGKRAPMGRAVAERADVAFVTSDNPRSEDPRAILADVLVGMRATEAFTPRARVVEEPDRRLAIRAALREARAGDVVLVAGKGHEATQTVGDEVAPFDDREVVREELS